jgi:hypothetical protein
MSTHKHYRDFGPISFVDEAGREYVPASGTNLKGDYALDWHMDVRIPIAANRVHLEETRMALEFAARNETVVLMQATGCAKGTVIASCEVLDHSSDDRALSSAAVSLRLLTLFDRAAADKAFARARSK